jgi:hypothetical protein
MNSNKKSSADSLNTDVSSSAVTKETFFVIVLLLKIFKPQQQTNKLNRPIKYYIHLSKPRTSRQVITYRN